MGIKVLSDQLASQIAAGEVVERPFSVVKELVENSIDAGATTINIDIREGGRQLIQIADNGSGIQAEELETAFLRHATSKLSTSNDLNAILTLGFRGEALAAIAAVSQVTVVTRARGEKAGTRLVLEGGRKASRDTVGAPQGTVIAVENLFYNVPARLKFLKSVGTEKRLIDEFVTRYALAYPNVRFRLTHNGRVTFQSTGSGSVRDVLLAIYGPETAKQLLEIGEQRLETGDESQHNLQSPINQSTNNSPFSVSGFVGPPSLHWSNRNHITLFVNGRWIRDNSLTYAVIQAYHTLLPTGRYPLGIIFISTPPELVDVNVHPAKTEVRFRQSKTPFGTVQRAVRKVLIDDSPVRSMGGGWGMNQFEPQTSANWTGKLGQSAFVRRGEETQAGLGLDWGNFGSENERLEIGNVGHGGHADGVEATGPVNPEPQPLPTMQGGDKLPIMRVVGQVGASYIITEGPDGMFLIDQHAAHERILYEQFMADWEKKQVVSQQLLAGTAVHLSPPQTTLLEEHAPALANIGFHVEPFGPNAVMVRGVPGILANQDPARVLTAVVEDLESGAAPLQDKIEARIVMRVCKTAAVKAGQTLSTNEMEAMIQQLEACHNPHTCPHGRPTLIHLSVSQLAREFGRT
ncbi:MAG: DNA mismatch repair endonuclease MutL [Chloroflexota bacterium]